jgi:drug/metabolite transporter (DMT)-like permease
VKTAIVLSLVVVLQAVGNICLSRGMYQVGALRTFTCSALIAFAQHTLTNPWVALAVALLLADFLLYLAALSWLDLSYVLPMTASSYILTALMAWLILGEAISATQWAGTLVVSGGVFLVGQSE